jgi:phospholipid-binding lipoprotein MlaA
MAAVLSAVLFGVLCTAAHAQSVTFVDLSGPASAYVARPQTPMPASLAQVDVAHATSVPPASGRGTKTYFVDLITGRQIETTPVVSAHPYAGDEADDPWEDFNRSHFGGHVFLQTNVIDPIEHVYTGVTPTFLRVMVHNFLTNLDSPKIFANDVLQLKAGYAAGTATRFVVNSSVGVAGLLDVATHIGISYHDNDFGQTLARYGAGDAPYILVPIVGPSNPRDLAGKVVDIFLDPLEYVTVPGGIYTSLGHAAIDQLDKRSFSVGHLDAIAETSKDPYAAERHEARERRRAEVAGFDNGPD